MARCEDFPCCGHYDEGTYNSWCPNPETGRYPELNLPRCKYCQMYYDPEEGHFDCDYSGAYDDDDDGEGEEDEFEEQLEKDFAGNEQWRTRSPQPITREQFLYGDD